MKTKPYDEYYRRQHRIVGHYLALQAWLRNLDCMGLDRSDLQALLNITNTGEERIKQFIEDIKPWFKFHKAYYRKSSGTYVLSLFLSRIAIKLPPGSKMSVDQRIAKAGTAGGEMRVERFSMAKIPSEKEMVSDLALFATGLKAPQVEKEAVKPRASQPITFMKPTKKPTKLLFG